MNNTLKAVMDIVFSSTRPLPAKFCTDEDSGRSQSFFIDPQHISAEEEYEIASQAYRTLCDIGSEKKSMNCLKIAEDIMLGYFLLTKKGGDIKSDTLKERIIEKNKKMLQDTYDSLEFLDLEVVQKQFAYCKEEGIRIALYNNYDYHPHIKKIVSASEENTLKVYLLTRAIIIIDFDLENDVEKRISCGGGGDVSSREAAGRIVWHMLQMYRVERDFENVRSQKTVSQEPVSYIFNYKCNKCRLEFAVYSWNKEWNDTYTNNYCPECGEQDCHLLWKKESEKHICQLSYGE